MTDDMIPDDIRQFILQNIASVAQLEGLLLLRADPVREWDAETMAARLYIEKREAARLLKLLSESGLLSADKPAHYRYQPKSPELDRTVESLADIYARSLLQVTHLIHSKPKTRMQEFADAFLIRKE